MSDAISERPPLVSDSPADDRAADARVVAGRPRSRRNQRLQRTIRFGFWPRVATVMLLTLVGFAFVYAPVLADVLAGSRTPLVAIAPLLFAIGISGYRSAARGVGDNESDWVVAALVAVAGLVVIVPLTSRYPSLASLWQLELVGAVMWAVCSALILFGLRHAIRSWPVWVLTLACLTPMPYHLVTAAFGGSDDAAAVVATRAGVCAAHLAARETPRGPRYVTSVLTTVVAVGTATVLIGHANLLVTTLVAGVIVPLLAVCVLRRFINGAGKHSRAAAKVEYPARSVRSLAALAVLALALLALNPPAPQPPAPQQVADDWLQRADLTQPEVFSFGARFLGPGSTLTRLRVAPNAGTPNAVVDVSTSTNLAALDDYADAPWYPSSQPVNYLDFVAGGDFQVPLGTRVIHSNSDSATASDSQDWYALTWVWRTTDHYQRVTVLITQAPNKSAIPPAPRPLSLWDTAVKPALWIARQQPETVGQVDSSVLQREHDVVDQLMVAGDFAQP